MFAAALFATLAAGCTALRPGTPAPRSGDEIVVAGQFFHTSTPVVLWLDPGGYDAYRIDKRFAPLERSSWAATTREADNKITSPARYGNREKPTTRRADEWDLAALQQQIDQFVIHYDVAGTSRQCFETLQDYRGLSVHFLIDLDGTIYQTLDLKERAYHATAANNRSVGVELANIGAYADADDPALHRWYGKDRDGRTRITVPNKLGSGGVRTADFVGRPMRDELVAGRVQGEQLHQYDFTPQQYAALARLTATLCAVLPRIQCQVPRDVDGHVVDHQLPPAELEQFRGILGHFHIQSNKTDPGPAMQWDRLVHDARRLMQ